MKIEPNPKNKALLLQKNPLTSCHLQTGWNNSGWLADNLFIYPMRQKTEKTYENNREAILELKKRQEKAIKEAEAAQEFKWKLEDKESDSEMEEKMRKLRGEPQSMKSISQRGQKQSLSTAETDKR